MARKPKHDYINDGIPELGVSEAWQGLFLLPSDYVDLSRLVERFSEIDLREKRALIRANVVRIVKLDRKGLETRSPYPARYTFTLADSVGSTVECDAFGTPWRGVEVGDTLTLLVQLKHSMFRSGLYFVSPQRAEQSPLPRVGYTGIPGSVAGEIIGLYAQNAIKDDTNVAKAVEWLAAERPVVARLIAKHWGEPSTLFKAVHSPRHINEGERALKFVKRLCKAEIRQSARSVLASSNAVIPGFPDLRKHVWDAWLSQPEKPSPEQLQALSAAVPALAGTRPARVLLNGDVGSGKTLVFLSIVVGFATAGKRCAIMAPNETLAQQIYRQATQRFPAVSCRYVAGGATAGPADAMIWVGTTALLHLAERPAFALVVIDEQHKFSRVQREGLLAPESHLVETTATPIPRSMLIALFDGVVLAKIGSAPVRKHIRSHIVAANERAKVTALHHAAIARGQKVIYLYAAVKEKCRTDMELEGTIASEQQSKDSLRAANAAYKSLDAAFPGRVALLHGQLPSERAREELEAFRTGERPILVASTAVEVGVDVPDVRLLVVNDCENFGIAQLHQLRGRLARNGGEADFVMHVRKQVSKDATKRLHAVRDTNDGFRLAERDLEIRGFGEVAGDMQSGATSTTFQLSRLTAADFITV